MKTICPVPIEYYSELETRQTKKIPIRMQKKTIIIISHFAADILRTLTKIRYGSKTRY